MINMEKQVGLYHNKVNFISLKGQVTKNTTVNRAKVTYYIPCFKLNKREICTYLHLSEQRVFFLIFVYCFYVT